MGVPGGDLTEFGCPDCRGVLAVREEGELGHLSFSCRVGHVYSGESLVKEKEGQLENSLWATVEVFEEVVLLHEELAARSQQNDHAHIARAYQRRSKRARAHIATLRALITQDGPATAERKQR
jgi:two-component system, chemotaxis family, protein-glutamate methylesterase/glutaminase